MMSKILNYVEEDESPLTIRGLINKFYAKSIIGPRGSIHQNIEKTYKVKLYLNNDTDDLGRLCSISGAPKNIAKAWCEVLSILFPKNSECTRAVLRFLIPEQLIRRLRRIPSKNIKNGCILNDIVSSSGTTLSITGSPIRNTTEHIMRLSVRISSTYLEQYNYALHIICMQFDQYRWEAFSPNNIYYTPGCIKKPPIIDDEEEDECNMYIKQQALKNEYSVRKNISHINSMNGIQESGEHCNNHIIPNHNHYHQLQQQYEKNSYDKKQTNNNYSNNDNTHTFIKSSSPILPPTPSDHLSTSLPASPASRSSHISLTTQSRLYSTNRKDKQKETAFINQTEVASSGWQSFSRGR